MRQVWIIGAGRFGLRALDLLAERRRDTRFVVVDSDPQRLEQVRRPRCTVELADGIDFLAERLGPGGEPQWIVPAIPLHVAAQWCMAVLGRSRIRKADIPRGIEPWLPHPIRGKGGDLYVTHASFLCPEDCPEPLDHCPVTHRPREGDMFEVLGNLQLPGFTALVLRSHQLGPGVGGYRPEALLSLLAQVEEARDGVLVATACRCHGVLTALVPA